MINLIRNFNNEECIWSEEGWLSQLNSVSAGERTADVAAIIVNRDRPDLVDELLEQLRGMGRNLVIDVFIIEMGSDPAHLHEDHTYYYSDEEFRGKCFGHNVGLRIARHTGQYRYFWILMNDVRFDPDIDAIQQLIDTSDKFPDIAILSPTELDSLYPASRPDKSKEFHVVSTCDYLGFLLRAKAVDEVGFLNPVFKYSWGAIHEYSYFLYKNKYRIAYSDKVVMKHLGGTTYGKTKNTISRESYQENAKAFCTNYFRDTYGDDWDDKLSSVLPEDIQINTFKLHRKYWENEVSGKRRAPIIKRLFQRVKRAHS
jgi:hypothetical protein